MKFSIYNLLVWTTIIAMGLWIVFQNTRRVVTIDVYTDRFDIHQLQLDRSRWPDRSQSPPLELPAAYSIANDLCQHLESRKDSLGLGEWNVVCLSIVVTPVFETNSDCSVYFATLEASEFPLPVGLSQVTEIQVMIFMDRTIAIDTKAVTHCGSAKLAEALLKFPNALDAASTLPPPKPPKNGGVF